MNPSRQVPHGLTMYSVNDSSIFNVCFLFWCFCTEHTITPMGTVNEVYPQWNSVVFFDRISSVL